MENIKILCNLTARILCGLYVEGIFNVTDPVIKLLNKNSSEVHSLKLLQTLHECQADVTQNSAFQN
jgi:hypothetical protein